MALPASAGTWRAVRWLVRHADEVLGPLGLYLLEQLDNNEPVADLAWVRMNLRFGRATPAGTTEDYAQFKLDLLNITSGAVDTSWVPADFTAVATALDAFATRILPFVSSTHTLKEYRAYKMRFNPSDPGPGHGPANPQRPFLDSGPPVYVLAKNVFGTGTSATPYQVACTVTLKTPWPKHWGRIYIPGAALGMTSSGRWVTASQQTIADAAFDLQDDLAAAGFLITVPVAQVAKERFHALLAPTSMVVDDIPDVIRRRRPKQAAVRAIGVE
jgi:hypothetical protein